MTDTASSSSSYKKARPSKMSAADKKAAQEAEWRKARMQWYAIAAFCVVAIVGAIVLISIFTEGELPNYDTGL